MTEPVVYVGKDLESMSYAVNYHRWILDFFNSHIGTRIVEVGAGDGAISEMILAVYQPKLLALVEPSREMFRRLQTRFGNLNTDACEAIFFNQIFTRVADELRARSVDTMVYVNVLEHIKDDDAELAAAHRTLVRGGKILIFVPAGQWLYGSYDAQLEHFRRYGKRELESKVTAAGFKIITARYFDCAGMLPWWLKYRVLRSKRMEAGAVRFYDSYVVPIMRRLESVVTPPLGKNLILIAEKVES